MTDVTTEARRLYELGFAVHWIKPNSKAPVKSGWTGAVRDDWETVDRDFREGYGLGVRLGEASKLIDGGFLASLDIDIKSSDPKHKAEALAFVEAKYPGLFERAPCIITGYGYRLFIKTEKPVQSGKLTASNDKVKVFMPSAPISKDQHSYMQMGLITQKELNAGHRVRGAWEVELMSRGKQVVLPPSIHPDTKRPYLWNGHGPLKATKEIPAVVVGVGENKEPKQKTANSTSGQPFSPELIDYMDDRFSAHIVKLIHGEGVSDRSAACFTVALAMVKAGFSDNEIVSTLTDRSTTLGETAYDHRKTDSVSEAAAWVRDYCLRKAKAEGDAARIFADAVVTETLTPEQAATQKKVLVSEVPWRSRLQRGGQNGEGALKPTLRNTLLILENAVPQPLFRRDTFAGRDSYGVTAPWTGGKKGKMVEDDDAVNIKSWIAEKYKFEPAVGIIYEAIAVIATKHSYHPVQEHLRSLPAWDGKERLNTWLKEHFAAKGSDEYLGQVFRKWLVASITRAFQPGAKFDWIPIFEGLQGTGKSSFGAILFGQKYFSDWLPNLADKDAALGLLGMRCVEFGELDRMKRNEISTVKAFITRQVDMVRPPYGRKTVELARGVVFFGTVNEKEYLQDDTGNRRFNPVKVGWLDFGALARDREQLWAEALFIYDLGLEASLYLEGDAAIEAVKTQESKQVKDESHLMAEAILEFIRIEDGKALEKRFNFSKFKLNKFFESMGPLEKWRFEMKNMKFASKALNQVTKMDPSIIFKHWKSDGLKVWGRV